MRVCEICGGDLAGRQKRFCSRRCQVTWFGPQTTHRARGLANSRFNGGLSTGPDGRALIVCRDYTWIPYYEGVVMAYHGHEMQPGEVIHHINGDPTDDRPENLQVLSRAEHLRIHLPELLAARGVTPRKMAA